MVEETMLFALLVVVVLIVLTILGLGLNLQSELLLNPRAARSIKALSRAMSTTTPIPNTTSS